MELIKMSKKGQLVVPVELRELLGLDPEDRFIAYGERDYVIFKKVELPAFEKEFERIVKVASKIAKEEGVTESTVLDEIKAHRRKKAS